MSENARIVAPDLPGLGRILDSIAAHAQLQYGTIRTRYSWLWAENNGLKSPGCKRIPVDVAGIKEGAKRPYF
jgi:hypothetical protein